MASTQIFLSLLLSSVLSDLKYANLLCFACHNSLQVPLSFLCVSARASKIMWAPLTLLALGRMLSVISLEKQAAKRFFCDLWKEKFFWLFPKKHICRYLIITLRKWKVRDMTFIVIHSNVYTEFDASPSDSSWKAYRIISLKTKKYTVVTIKVCRSP